MRPILICAALGALIMPAAAQMSIETMQRASGIATVIGSAEACGYAINDAALASYYTGNDLARPEVLSWIDMQLSIKAADAAPSGSACTLARSTAQAIGVLAP